MADLTLPAPPVAKAQTRFDADMALRTILFVAVLLCVWVSFHPFPSLAEAPSEVTEGGDRVNQLGFSTMFLVLAGWTYFHQPRRVKLLLGPCLLAMLAWCAVTVVLSWEPSLAARRLAFTVVIMSIAGMMLLLPKNLRHFSDLMAVVVLVVLAVCYLGILLVPSLAVHQATDFLEPEHAGSWRGLFAHKNEAGASMVLIIFIGLFVARTRNLILGGAIVVLAATFLLFSLSKTAMGVLPMVLLFSAILVRSRRPAVGITLVVTVLALFNLFSVGSVVFEPVRKLVESVIPDATFTGRTELWELALQYAGLRPITGYGFGAFWGTEQVVYGLGDNSSWVNSASDAHNAYVNLALTVGIPGLILVIIWIVILPVLDSYKVAQATKAPAAPLQLLFLRICLYGTYASCFESTIFQQIGATWFLFLMSALGLRYLSLTRVAA